MITFTQFEEGDVLSGTSEDADIDDESGDKSNEYSIMPPPLSLEELNVLDSGDESDNEPMST